MVGLFLLVRREALFHDLDLANLRFDQSFDPALPLFQIGQRDLKRRHHELSMMISSIDDRGVRISANNKDETKSWRAQLQVWIGDIEDLLRKHPSGLPSQI